MAAITTPGMKHIIVLGDCRCVTRLARLVRAREVVRLERGLGEHGERLDLGDDVATEAELVDEVEDDLGVLVGVVVAGEDTGDQGEAVFR